MNYDLLLFAIVAIFGIFGLISGLLGQVFRIVALAAAYFLAKPLGPTVGGFLHLHASPVVVDAAGVMAAWLLVYVILSIVFSILTRLLVKVPGVSMANRIGGLALGLAKGGLIAFVIGALVLTFNDFAKNAKLGARVRTNGSFLAPIVADHNPITALIKPMTDKVQALVQASKSPEKHPELAKDPVVLKLMQNPNVLSLAHDKKMSALVERGDTLAILQDPRVAKLLADPEILAMVRKLDLGMLKGTDLVR